MIVSTSSSESATRDAVLHVRSQYSSTCLQKHVRPLVTGWRCWHPHQPKPPERGHRSWAIRHIYRCGLLVSSCRKQSQQPADRQITSYTTGYTKFVTLIEFHQIWTEIKMLINGSQCWTGLPGVACFSTRTIGRMRKSKTGGRNPVCKNESSLLVCMSEVCKWFNALYADVWCAKTSTTITLANKFTRAVPNGTHVLGWLWRLNELIEFIWDFPWKQPFKLLWLLNGGDKKWLTCQDKH